MNPIALRILAGIVLLALVLVAHTLDFREAKLQEAMLAVHDQTKFYTPYGEADCRVPKKNEFRYYLEWCADVDKCYRSCDIVPRDPDAKRSDNKKRVFTKS